MQLDQDLTLITLRSIALPIDEWRRAVFSHMDISIGYKIHERCFIVFTVDVRIWETLSIKKYSFKVVPVWEVFVLER